MDIQLTIIPPFRAKNPSGGFKVLLEYTNRLSAYGYKINVLFPLNNKYLEYRQSFGLRKIQALFTKPENIKWFKINPNIKCSYINNIDNNTVPDSDILLITSWTTALATGKLSIEKGHRINLVQGIELQGNNENLLFQSYNQKYTTNVVVSKHVKYFVKKHSSSNPIVIHNAIDQKQYYIENSITNRNPLTICMLYSSNKIKGCNYGIEALHIVKQYYPQLKVELFGVEARPNTIPDWMEYQRKPSDLNRLFNRNAIFIANSLTEGMALTPLEAMTCGCALICTNIGGYKEYAIDNETALLAEPKNSQQMADKICILLENNALRIELAKNGAECTQQFTWENAVNKMHNLIQDILKEK